MNRRKKNLLFAAGGLALLASASLIAFVSTYGYDGPVSDHFDGSSFSNLEPGDHSFGDMVKWMWEMETVPWPEWIEDPVRPAPPERVGRGELRVTFINHATVLIQFDRLNILTDPVWSETPGPFGLIGPRRVRAPGIGFVHLPPIDFVLVSHDHWDHLDLPTIERLTARDHPQILTGLGVKGLLPGDLRKNAEEMDWWQTFKSVGNGAKFTFVPARHQSGRWPFVENTTLWGGFVIESGDGDRVYFAGDTGYGSFFDSVAKRFDNIRLAILPIGNYEARWIMRNQHMNPDDAVKAHRLLNAGRSIGIHYATFEEHPEQAIDAHETDLASALTSYGVDPSEFRILGFGESVTVVDLD